MLNSPLADGALLRLVQLTSPALPVGGFAYSQGLEYASEAGWVNDSESALEWMTGLLEKSVARLDLPLLALSHAAFRSADAGRVHHYARLLHAMRETAELQKEEQQIGRSLARCLLTLGIAEAEEWTKHDRATFMTLYALAGASWEIPARTAALGYSMAWAQNQVSAALRLLSIGQLAGQRMLSALMMRMPQVVDSALARTAEADIGFTAPAQVLASALHETQYCRLFRS